MSIRQELQLHDPLADMDYDFALAPTETGGGKLISIETKDWEPADGSLPWRTAIHPWKAGLAQDRIEPHLTFSGTLANRPSLVYGKANADASNGNFITAPPALNTLGSVVETVYFNTPEQLRYDGYFYGGTTYMGAGSATTGLFHAIRNFNGKAYFAGGQFLYSMDASYNFAIVKDFGAGKTVFDIEIFNNELIVAMGETEKIWKMTTAESFTQATNATYAIALGTVNDELWRATSVNQLTNCITAPLTLTSWVPSDVPYTAGDTTYSVSDLIEYAGVIVAMRPDGVFFPDSETIFRNQAPQLAIYPNLSNGLGSWTAWGYLWVPSSSGLLRVTLQESPAWGPEKTHRHDFRFWVRSGVEWNGAMYLLCTDEAESEETFVCKMERDEFGVGQLPYTYHEWARLGGVSKGYFMVVYTQPTNPTMIAGFANGLKYWLMGRGSGLDIDDSNYEFGTDYELESGDLIPTGDLNILTSLTGVKVVGKQPAGGTLTLQYQLDGSGDWVDMKSSQEGAGITPISTVGFFGETRYAPINETQARMLQIKLVGTLPANVLGRARPEIRECFAFGEAVPDSTDIITCGIYADQGAKVFGLGQGLTPGDLYQLLSKWCGRRTILKARIPDYYTEDPVEVIILSAKETNVNAVAQGQQQVNSAVIQITMRRVDFAGLLNV